MHHHTGEIFSFLTFQPKPMTHDRLTWHIIPLCPIGNAIFKGFWGVFGAVGLAGLHHGMFLRVRQGQVAKQSIVRWLAVETLALMLGRIIKWVTGNNCASMQVPRQHKPGETTALWSFSFKMFNFMEMDISVKEGMKLNVYPGHLSV